MAIVDAQYRFTFIDVGVNGSNADGAIFNRSAFGLALVNGELDIPPTQVYPTGQLEVFCHTALLQIKLFHLGLTLSRQHRLSEAEQVFNYRLSHARGIVENVFGILAQRFHIFNRRIPLVLLLAHGSTCIWAVC